MHGSAHTCSIVKCLVLSPYVHNLLGDGEGENINARTLILSKLHEDTVSTKLFTFNLCSSLKIDNDESLPIIHSS